MSSDPLTTRRDFLQKGMTLVGVGAATPTLLGRATTLTGGGSGRSSGDHRILVLLQLAGGNDGLNTVVPFRRDAYYRARPTLAIPRQDVLRIDDEHGFHPAAAGLKQLYDQGLLSIIQGVGYPDASRSHLSGTDVWHKADPRHRLHDGWLARYFDSACATGSPDPGLALAFTREAPLALRSDRFEPLVVRRPESPDALNESLQLLARDIAAGLSARVCYLSMAGFDTHAAQAVRHATVLRQLADGLTAFVNDLRASGNLDRTLVMTVSEFGRRVEENASAGTDHGQAAPMFLIGTGVKPGLHGRHPDLDPRQNNDLAFTTDFRSVYAAVLQDWLNVDSDEILGQRFAPVDVLST